MDIKTCLVRLTYYDKSENVYYYRHHIVGLDLDESIEDQIYDMFGHLIPVFTDFKWQEIININYK